MSRLRAAAPLALALALAAAGPPAPAPADERVFACPARLALAAGPAPEGWTLARGAQPPAAALRGAVVFEGDAADGVILKPGRIETPPRPQAIRHHYRFSPPRGPRRTLACRYGEGLELRRDLSSAESCTLEIVQTAEGARSVAVACRIPN